MAERRLTVEVVYETNQASAQRAAQAVRDYGVRPQSELTDALKRTGSAAAGMHRQMDIGRILAWAGAWTLTYRAIRLLESGIADAITQAMQFDAALRNVNTIAKLSERGLGEIRAAVVNLSTDSRAGNRSIDELAKALYQINSAGIVGAKSLEVLRAAGAAARAGLTDVNTAATGLVSVLNAYGLSTRDAARVSDILFKTVEIGVPNFENLSRTIGKVAATASIAQIPAEELGLVWAAVSRVLVDADHTTDSLNRVIIAFLNPTEAMREAVQRLGFDSADTMLKQLGLIESMKRLYTITGDNASAIRSLFQTQQAFRGAAVLMANDLRVLTQAQADWGKVGDEAGATQRALAEQMKSHTARVDTLRREWERLKIELGTGVVPALSAVAKGMADVLRVHREFQEAMTATRTAREARIRESVWGPGGRYTVRPEPTRGEGGPLADILRRLEAQTAAPAARGPQPQTLEQLLRIFERHRALDKFGPGGEIRGIGEILIPRAEKELGAARERAERLLKTLGESAEETKKAFQDIKKLEDELLRLETQRVGLAKELATEYKAMGAALQQAVRNLRATEIVAAENAMQGFARSIALAVAPLQRFGDLMGQQAQVRARVHALTMQQYQAEIDMLKRLIATETDPAARAAFGGRLQDVLARRAADASAFDIATKQDAFAKRQAALDQRIANIDTMLQAPGADAAMDAVFAKAEERLQRALMDPRQKFLEDLRARLTAQKAEPLTFTEEEIAKPYRDAADAIAKIQSTVVDPALRKSQDEARAIATAAYDATLKMHGQIVNAWSAMGTDAGKAFRRAFLDEYGQIPGGFPRPGGSAPGTSEIIRERTGGSVTNINLNGVSIASRLQPETIDDLIGAVMGARGDLAVRRARRHGVASPVV